MARRLTYIVVRTEKVDAVKTVKVRWEWYTDFFELYQKEKNEQKLLYVIGEKKLCYIYIGSVGSRGGKNGLAKRYDKPYIERAKSIFGSSHPRNQPAFADKFSRGARVQPPDILNAERMVQKSFEEAYPHTPPCFKRRGKIYDMKIVSEGERPSFLPQVYMHNNSLNPGSQKPRAGRLCVRGHSEDVGVAVE
ncbi:MAG: hypothetical protein ACE5HN_03715 [Nitrospiria bacterium]